MKIVYFLISVFIFSSIEGISQRREPLDITMDWESYDPPSSLVVPENPTPRAKFPFIDIHSHHWRIGEQNVDELIEKLDGLNMQVVVNLSGRGGERLKPKLTILKNTGMKIELSLSPI